MFAPDKNTLQTPASRSNVKKKKREWRWGFHTVRSDIEVENPFTFPLFVWVASVWNYVRSPATPQSQGGGCVFTPGAPASTRVIMFLLHGLLELQYIWKDVSRTNGAMSYLEPWGFDTISPQENARSTQALGASHTH